MASWKKVLVSGSSIHVNEVTASSLTNDNIVVVGPGGALQNSGITWDGQTLNGGSNTTASFAQVSGSFVGDGSGLTGLGSDLSIAADSGSGNILLVSETLTFTGAGLTTTINGNSVTHSVSYGSIAGTSVQGNTNFSLSGTANEIEITGIAAQALGAGPTYTIGLPNDVVIGNNLTVTGDLFIQGTATTVNTANLLVEDKFILLNSGSANPAEGGIIIDNGSGIGHTFFFESGSAPRWGFNSAVTSTATTATASAYVAAVVDVDGSQSDIAEYQKRGNIKVESGEIYIYT